MENEAIDAAVRREIEAGWFPGAVVLAGRPGAVRYHRAFGHARLRPAPVPMRPDAVFDIASVTKVVATATAAALCADEGLLDLDAPVRAYLPEFRAPDVTVAHLGAHTSGIDNAKFDHLGGEAMLRAMVAAPPVRPPDAAFEYSCRNFVLLGLVVEAVTGRRLDDFCATRIFHPLGMADTRFGSPADRSRLAGSEREIPGEISDGQARAAGRAVGNAGVFSTAADLARFAEMMLGDGARAGVRILSARTHAAITGVTTPPGIPARGFGWDLRGPADCPARGHHLSGSAYGHTGWTGQSLWIDPERGAYVIVLTNRTHPHDRGDHEGSARARGRITDALLERLPA